jgi:hypothetical protein
MTMAHLIALLIAHFGAHAAAIIAALSHLH